MLKYNIKKSIYSYLLIVTAIFGLLFITPNYRHFPILGSKDFILTFIHWGISVSGIFILLTLTSLNRVVFSILFPIFTLITGITAYFVWRIDLGISVALIESIFLTNSEEIGSYISTSLILWTIALLLLIFLLMKWRFKILLKRNDIILTLFTFIVFIVIFISFNKIRNNSFIQRSPFSYYSAYKDYIKQNANIKSRTLLIDDSISRSSDSLITVFVIGESLRSDYVQMNGYHRVTMPKMEERNVVYIPNVYSPYTHTSASVSYIMTPADSSNLDLMFNKGSFINLFNNAGYRTSWIANQNPLSSFIFFVNETDSQFINKPFITDYSNSQKLDSDLITPFKDIVNNDISNQLIILHFAGNHWWYNKNMPDNFIHFKPILENRELSLSNKERMINSYDNVSLFVDSVLDEMIKELENKNALLIFLSDHGESFGENGQWLHANDSDIERNPACFIWMSDIYQEQYPEKVKNLILNSNKKINTSFLFHTILDGSNIESNFLDRKESLFNNEYQ